MFLFMSILIILALIGTPPVTVTRTVTVLGRKKASANTEDDALKRETINNTFTCGSMDFVETTARRDLMTPTIP